jgi:hypothetical protein
MITNLNFEIKADTISIKESQNRIQIRILILPDTISKTVTMPWLY